MDASITLLFEFCKGGEYVQYYRMHVDPIEGLMITIEASCLKWMNIEIEMDRYCYLKPKPWKEVT